MIKLQFPIGMMTRFFCKYPVQSRLDGQHSGGATWTQVAEQNVSRLNWRFALLLKVNLDLGGRENISGEIEHMRMKTILKRLLNLKQCSEVILSQLYRPKIFNWLIMTQK